MLRRCEAREGWKRMRSEVGRGLLAVCCGLMLGMVAMGAACGPSGSKGHQSLTVERSYELHCVGCHGSKGEGAWGSNIQGLKSSLDEIAHVIAKGEGKMPGYDDHLSESEIREMAEYVKAFKMGAERSPAP
jgi:cytochrome c553